MSLRIEGTDLCQVLGTEKLSAASGGGRAICTEIKRAVTKAAPNANYTAKVSVVSKSRLLASLVVNGRPLPDQHFAIMDRDLNAGAIQRFAASVADAIAVASKASK